MGRGHGCASYAARGRLGALVKASSLPCGRRAILAWSETAPRRANSTSSLLGAGADVLVAPEDVVGIPGRLHRAQALVRGAEGRANAVGALVADEVQVRPAGRPGCEDVSHIAAPV